MHPNPPPNFGHGGYPRLTPLIMLSLGLQWFDGARLLACFCYYKHMESNGANHSQIYLLWGLIMIDFSKAIRMDKIASMTSKEFNELNDLLTPKESKTALEQVKETLAKGEGLWDLPMHTLMDAIEIKMNSVGYYHNSLDTVYYDLYQIAEQLAKHYAYSPIKKQIAQFIYDVDYFCYYDNDDDDE